MVSILPYIRRLSPFLLAAAPTKINNMPPNQQHGILQLDFSLYAEDGIGGGELSGDNGLLRCALLGCGMMGQEHCSYLMGYGSDVRLDFFCDPHEESLQNCLRVMKDFNPEASHHPRLMKDESELLRHVDDIDLLVIASPNYLHTDQLLRWGKHDLTILVEKPVSVSKDQLDRLQEFSTSTECIARIWVAMEYRFIPAISKLLSLLPSIGDVSYFVLNINHYYQSLCTFLIHITL